VQSLWSEFSAASLVGGIELAVEGKRKKERKRPKALAGKRGQEERMERVEEGRG